MSVVTEGRMDPAAGKTEGKDGRNDSRRVVSLIALATRLVGLTALLAVVFPPGRRMLRSSLAELLGLPHDAQLAALVVTTAAGMSLLLLAAGLRRRKRRAWQVAVMLTGLIVALHLVFRHGLAAGVAAAALLVALLLARRHYTALPDRSVSRMLGVWAFLQLIVVGTVINFLVLTLAPHGVVGRPTTGDRLAHAALSLIGVSGPVRFRSELLDNLTASLGLVFGIGAVLLGGYFLLRSAEPKPSLSAEDERRIRDLLALHGGRDSLGYFAVRRDKSVVFSPTGKAAVTYRVLAGVALASGDPLGDVEAWPGAIEEFLETCLRYGWVPAVLGCSERGATVWARHRLDAIELGDEAVVDTETFTLDGRPMRGVRQMATRARRAGYEVRVRRSAELDGRERAMLADLAEAWRGSDTERGFSMALSRVGDPEDPDCVLVTAEQYGTVRGVLQFVPWGADGLSLDLMRRDRDVPDNGLTELMIADLLLACRGLGVRRVSLNFAMFRSALARGQRIGAGPVARWWAKVLRWGSRWWQIESLYRFNAKFQPSWVPRFLVFPTVRDLPRIALAVGEAEGFGGRPPALLRILRRPHHLG